MTGIIMFGMAVGIFFYLLVFSAAKGNRMYDRLAEKRVISLKETKAERSKEQQ